MNYLDFLIEGKLISRRDGFPLEIKSVNALTNVHLFQVLKYLGYTGLDVALLVNFGREKLDHKRVLPTEKMLNFREKKDLRNNIHLSQRDSFGEMIDIINMRVFYFNHLNDIVGREK